jgi:uncharacterized protein (DUF58 family)
MRSLLRQIQIEREAWVRFFLALGGLALAFAAAVCSTVARDSGNPVAAAILASLALLLAGGVGLFAVPYLARRVVAGRVRDAMDYEVTREGMAYLALVLVIGIAALNSGNNLLFIVVAAMLAAVLASGIASLLVLRDLELDLVLPAHVFACSAVPARFTVRNPRRYWPSFSIAVTALSAKGRAWRWRAHRSTFAFPWWRPPERQWFRMPDFVVRLEPEQPSGPAIFTGNVYFSYLAPRSTTGAEVQLSFPRRGSYRQEALGLATRFPFSFFKKTRRVDLVRELVVYPSVQPTDSSLAVLPMITGECETFVRGRGYDLYRIRDYQPEDPRRHVDWKATAKTGELKVREFTREDERKLRIVFDNPAPGMLPETGYEDAVQLTASLAWHFAAEDTELSFAARGYQGGPDVYDFLHFLALIEPAGGLSVLDELEVTDDYNLVVTARSRGSIPTALWSCSYVVFLNGNANLYLGHQSAAEQKK